MSELGMTYVQRLHVLVEPLINRRITYDRRLKIYRSAFQALPVDVFGGRDHTQSRLGYIRVEDQKDGSVKCFAVYLDFADEFTHTPVQIEMSADTPEEIVEKFSGCIAGILES